MRIDMKNMIGLLLCSLPLMLAEQDSDPTRIQLDRKPTSRSTEQKPARLTLSWADNYLTIRGPKLPKEGIRVHYLEAYCRPGSTDRDWAETVIKHKTELVSANERQIRLRCT